MDNVLQHKWNSQGIWNCIRFSKSEILIFMEYFIDYLNDLDIKMFFIKNNLKYEDWYERHHAFNQWISIVLKRFIKHVSTQFLLLCSFWQKVIKDQCRVKSFRNWTLNFILLTLVVLDDGQVAFYRLQTLMTVFVAQPVSSINTISMCIVFRCSRRKTTFYQCLSLFFPGFTTRIYCLS